MSDCQPHGKSTGWQSAVEIGRRAPAWRTRCAGVGRSLFQEWWTLILKTAPSSSSTKSLTSWSRSTPCLTSAGRHCGGVRSSATPSGTERASSGHRSRAVALRCSVRIVFASVLSGPNRFRANRECKPLHHSGLRRGPAHRCSHWEVGADSGPERVWVARPFRQEPIPDRFAEDRSIPQVSCSALSGARSMRPMLVGIRIFG
jgi:hypothetical protein